MSVLQGHSVLFQLGYLILVPQLSHIFRSFFINFFFASFPSWSLFHHLLLEEIEQEHFCVRGRRSLGCRPRKTVWARRQCTTGGREADPALYGIVSCKDDFARTESPSVHRCHHVGRTRPILGNYRPRKKHGPMPGWHATWMRRKKGQETRACRTCMHVTGGEESVPEGVSGRLFGSWDV